MLKKLIETETVEKSNEQVVRDTAGYFKNIFGNAIKRNYYKSAFL